MITTKQLETNIEMETLTLNQSINIRNKEKEAKILFIFKYENIIFFKELCVDKISKRKSSLKYSLAE
jgi:hypothetical protein